MKNHSKISLSLHTSVFSIWKSLRVLQKVCIKIVACAIYTCQIFSYAYTLLFWWKMKSCCHRCFPQQVRPQTTFQWYVLWDYSSVKIGFNMINKRHTLRCNTLHGLLYNTASYVALRGLYINTTLISWEKRKVLFVSLLFLCVIIWLKICVIM